MMRLGMLPCCAMTLSRSMVSTLPTTSDNTRGRYFSTHGRSPSDGAGEGEEEEEEEGATGEEEEAVGGGGLVGVVRALPG